MKLPQSCGNTLELWQSCINLGYEYIDGLMQERRNSIANALE